MHAWTFMDWVVVTTDLIDDVYGDWIDWCGMNIHIRRVADIKSMCSCGGGGTGVGRSTSLSCCLTGLECIILVLFYCAVSQLPPFGSVNYQSLPICGTGVAGFEIGTLLVFISLFYLCWPATCMSLGIGELATEQALRYSLIRHTWDIATLSKLSAEEYSFDASRFTLLQDGSVRYFILPRHNIQCTNITTVSGQTIPWVDTVRYLGRHIFAKFNRHYHSSLPLCCSSTIYGK